MSDLNSILHDHAQDFRLKSLELQDFFSKVGTKFGLIQILRYWPVLENLPDDMEIMINDGGTYRKLRTLILRRSPYDNDKIIIEFEFKPIENMKA